MSSPNPDSLNKCSTEMEDATLAVKAAAEAAGFGLCGITSAETPSTMPQFETWVDAGMSGEMHYIPKRREAYGDLNRVLEGVRSVIVVALDYRTETPAPSREGYGRISRYAWGQTDYHTVIRSKLRAVADVLHHHAPQCRTRGVVDTAPVLERDLARRAGLGWFGKNTMLISKSRGSFFFLGALLTDAELIVDPLHKTDHCGTCTACLEACPTNAFVGPYILDARKCISYLTIELRDQSLPRDHGSLDDWVFGCDVCQDVCPWNSKSQVTDEPAFQPVEHIPLDVGTASEGTASENETMPGLISLESILAMTEDDFAARFQGTPVERTGLTTLQRNAAEVQKNQHGSERLRK